LGIFLGFDDKMYYKPI